MSSQNTSIGSCPSHWEVVKFSSVAELKHGYQFRTTDFTEQGIKILKITQIKDNGSIDISSCSYIDSKRLKSFENNVVKRGDILMALSGATIGKIGRYKSDEIVLQNYRVGNFVPLDEQVLNKDYFYHFLTTENTYYQILANQNQSAQENVGKEDIHNMLVFLPPPPEQKSIASILSSLDDKIDLLHRQNATLEKMAETLFRQWFVEEAKEDWETKQLKEITDIGIGRTPPRKESKWFSTNLVDVKWISIKDLGADGVFISNTSEYLTREAIETFNIPVIPPDTVVLSFKMTVGRVAITSEKMLSNEAIAHFKFNKETPFSKVYLYLFLKTYKYESLGSTSSIVTAINSAMIKEMEILIPDESTMKTFKDYTVSLFNKIKSNQTQIRTLTALRDTLLPKLMSGEVKVSE